MRKLNRCEAELLHRVGYELASSYPERDTENIYSGIEVLEEEMDLEQDYPFSGSNRKVKTASFPAGLCAALQHEEENVWNQGECPRLEETSRNILEKEGTGAYLSREDFQYLISQLEPFARDKADREINEYEIALKGIDEKKDLFIDVIGDIYESSL